jgi:DNA-directed RNA polymerase subunit M/transcription elongation factor TFIIS
MSSSVGDSGSGDDDFASWAEELNDELMTSSYNLEQRTRRAKSAAFACSDVLIRVLGFAAHSQRACLVVSKTWRSSTQTVTRETVSSKLTRALSVKHSSGTSSGSRVGNAAGGGTEAKIGVETGAGARAGAGTRTLSRQAIQAISTAVESALFELAKRSTSRFYHQRARQLLLNLSGKSNGELRGRLISGEVTPVDLVRMSTEELAPAALMQQRKEWKTKHQTQVTIRGFPGHVMCEPPEICPCCQSKQTMYRQKRRKLAVDRMHIFYRCLDCSHMWE